MRTFSESSCPTFFNYYFNVYCVGTVCQIYHPSTTLDSFHQTTPAVKASIASSCCITRPIKGISSKALGKGAKLCRIVCHRVIGVASVGSILVSDATRVVGTAIGVCGAAIGVCRTTIGVVGPAASIGVESEVLSFIPPFSDVFASK